MGITKHNIGFFSSRCAIVVGNADVFALPQPDPAKYARLHPKTVK